jgi:hypothetical protein
MEHVVMEHVVIEHLGAKVGGVVIADLRSRIAVTCSGDEPIRRRERLLSTGGI